ncbi:T9SS type A sorting domain-containing protein [Flavobacterium dankookense]|uniref:Putative secreted protein (Por secretion system target) n=1 Tax=Flavobacterium dankookense TaxID=706186 RepID=A0A4R6Q800_9FLAO|nr:T9SS type A sorting domain-containing protein [Flavobacterium dankookense]TDP58235.1 putative secreted protein (Por secretion system target) [Flavobacterium dankookense]
MKRILILLFSNIVFSQTQIGSSLNGTFAEDRFGQSTTINSTGNIIAVGAPTNSQVGNETGQVTVFSFDGENWNQLGGLLNGLTSSDEVNFGSSLSISSNGEILAVGSPNYDSIGNDFGAVQIFKFENSNWVQLGNTIIGTQDNSFTGASISLSSDGNRIAVGSPGKSIDGLQRGNVTIYELVSNVWSQLGTSIIGDLNQVFFGNQIKLNSTGDNVIISDFNIDIEPTKIGKVKVYSFDGTNWTQKGNSIVGLLSEDNRLKSVDMSNDASTIVIGIPGSDVNGNDSGKVRVYSFNNTDWLQKGLDINGTLMSDLFGFSVKLFNSGNGIIIGSPNFNNKGKMSFYEYISNNWQQSGNDVIGENVGDFFGISISISENNLVSVGAFGNDTNGNNSGQVKVFDINSSLKSSSFINNRVTVYPNPVENYLFFNSEGKIVENILINNCLGMKILNKSFLNNNLLDIEDFPKGVYFLEYSVEGTKYYQNILKK